MKTNDIKPEFAANALRGAVTVTNFEELKEVGLAYGGYSFREGQTLYIPDTWSGLDVQATTFNDTKLYYILMGVNDSVMRIPINAFRKRVSDWETVYKDYPINAQIMGCINEYTRVEYLLGKVFRVSKLIEAKTAFYRNGELQVDEEGHVKLINKDYPIFELV